MKRLTCRILLGNDRGRYSLPISAFAIMLVSLVLLLGPDVTPFGADLMLGIAVASTAMLIVLMLDQRTLLRNLELTLTGGLILAALTLSFAGVYYRQSQAHTHAFNVRLDRITAVYVAIGTLSTNGTPGVEARSPGARADIVGQEAVDASLVVLFFGALMWRLGYRAASAATGQRDSGERSKHDPARTLPATQRSEQPSDAPHGRWPEAKREGQGTVVAVPTATPSDAKQ